MSHRSVKWVRVAREPPPVERPEQHSQLLCRLPAELILYIGDYVSMVDHAILSQTCAALRGLMGTQTNRYLFLRLPREHRFEHVVRIARDHPDFWPCEQCWKMHRIDTTNVPGHLPYRSDEAHPPWSAVRQIHMRGKPPSFVRLPMIMYQHMHMTLKLARFKAMEDTNDDTDDTDGTDTDDTNDTDDTDDTDDDYRFVPSRRIRRKYLRILTAPYEMAMRMPSDHATSTLDYVVAPKIVVNHSHSQKHDSNYNNNNDNNNNTTNYNYNQHYMVLVTMKLDSTTRDLPWNAVNVCPHQVLHHPVFDHFVAAPPPPRQLHRAINEACDAASDGYGPFETSGCCPYCRLDFSVRTLPPRSDKIEIRVWYDLGTEATMPHDPEWLAITGRVRVYRFSGSGVFHRWNEKPRVQHESGSVRRLYESVP